MRELGIYRPDGVFVGLCRVTVAVCGRLTVVCAAGVAAWAVYEQVLEAALDVNDIPLAEVRMVDQLLYANQ
jgi:hypothetical protein